MVGRGLYLRPYHPYELKRVLFEHGALHQHVSRETNQTYVVPAGYEVDESPPSPNGASLNVVSIEESWERFQKKRTLDASVAGQSAAFSVSATMSQGNELREEQEAYYANRSTFVALWSLYIEDPSACVDIDTSSIPTPFRPESRDAYEAFFQRYGTHYVKRAWVGGRAEIVVTVAKASNMSKADIQAGITSSFAGVSGEIKASESESRARVRTNSRCTVLGRGGDETRLAAMGDLDRESYNAWIKTIRDNPQTIEIELAGVWTLLRGEPEKARALMKAYSAASTFSEISAVFRSEDLVYFLRGQNFFTYDLDSGQSMRERPVVELWPALDEVGFERVDAAFQIAGLDAEDPSRRKVYMFRRGEYISFDIATSTIDEGYPRRIHDGWPGIAFRKIDAVVATGLESIYFFAGGQYVRFNGRTGRVDDGYPQKIQRRWIGVTFDRIDAAIYWGGGKIYFFRGDQHIRYDIATLRADPGYPKPVVGNYVEDWHFFD